MQPDAVTAITGLGVDYHLMTQYTSFVAVDTSHKTTASDGGTVDTPVEMPDGVSYQGIYGTPPPTAPGQASSMHASSRATGGFAMIGSITAISSGAIVKQPNSSYQNAAGLQHSTAPALPAAPPAATTGQSGNRFSGGFSRSYNSAIPMPSIETGFFDDRSSGVIYHIKLTPGQKIRNAEIDTDSQHWMPMIFDTRTGCWSGSAETGSGAMLRITTVKGDVFTLAIGYPGTGKDGTVALRIDDAGAFHAATAKLAGGNVVPMARQGTDKFEGSHAAPAKGEKPGPVTYTLDSADGKRTTVTIGP